MVFMAISHLRRKDPAKLAPSGDEPIGEKDFSFFDILPAEKVEDNDIYLMMVEDVATLIPEKRFGYSKTFEWQGRLYESNVRSLALLTLLGWEKKDLAEKFGVTQSRVAQLLSGAFGSLTKEQVMGVVHAR